MVAVRQASSGPFVDVEPEGGGGGGSTFTLVALVEGPGQATANAALIQAANNAGTKLLQLPRGTFELDRVSLSDGVWLRGEGPEETILQWVTDPLTVDEGPVGLINVGGSGVRLEAFAVDANKAGVTVGGAADPANVHAVSFVAADQCSVSRLRVQSAHSSGLNFQGCTECAVLDVTADSCDGFGFNAAIASSKLAVERFVAIECGAALSRGGFGVEGSPNESQQVSFRSCEARSCAVGFSILGFDNNLDGCSARTTQGGAGFLIAGGGNRFAACYAQSGALGSDGFFFGTTITADRNTLWGCQSDGNTGFGFHLDTGSVNNMFSGCSGTGNLAGNVFSFEAGANNNIVIGSVIGAVADAGTGNVFANNF